jgi:3-phenylpropionate/trans-cinnamate dioxygenase ferredoxin reductase subunit
MHEDVATVTGPIVVVGGGQAGYQVAASLRDEGFAGPLTIVGDEPGLPYQRPPLSKAYLAADGGSPDSLTLRPQSFYDKHLVDLVGEPAIAIDRSTSVVCLRSGRELPYAHLVLATGTRARLIPVPGLDLDGVLTLRTRADADALRARLSPDTRVVVIGGGFIGMEVAAAACKAGAATTVIETLDRVLARAAAPEISAHVTAMHADHGVRVLLGQVVAAVRGDAGRVTGVELGDGTLLAADVVVVGVGVVPNVELAEAAGLPVDNGVVVDEQLLTADPAISAIGDCASYPSPHAGCRTRLESVQNAVDHARHVAARLTGGPVKPYGEVPWFWTHQFDMRIQMAGIGRADDRRVVYGEPATGKFSVFRFQGDRLMAVESVNRTGDHISARKALAGDRLPTPAEVAAAGFDFKAFVAKAGTAG